MVAHSHAPLLSLPPYTLCVPFPIQALFFPIPHPSRLPNPYLRLQLPPLYGWTPNPNIQPFCSPMRLSIPLPPTYNGSPRSVFLLPLTWSVFSSLAWNKECGTCQCPCSVVICLIFCSSSMMSHVMAKIWGTDIYLCVCGRDAWRGLSNSQSLNTPFLYWNTLPLHESWWETGPQLPPAEAKRDRYTLPFCHNHMTWPYSVRGLHLWIQSWREESKKAGSFRAYSCSSRQWWLSQQGGSNSECGSRERRVGKLWTTVCIWASGFKGLFCCFLALGSFSLFAGCIWESLGNVGKYTIPGSENPLVFSLFQAVSW